MNRRSLLKGALGLAAATALEEPTKKFWPGWSQRDSGITMPNEELWKPEIGNYRQIMEWSDALSPQETPFLNGLRVAYENRMISTSFTQAMLYGDYTINMPTRGQIERAIIRDQMAERVDDLLTKIAEHYFEDESKLVMNVDTANLILDAAGFERRNT
jgi:hypothetical protein